MNFLVPLAFVSALVLPLIILMYLLRLKRQKVVLSSILLWRKSLQDLQANAPFQKLRNNLLLWLQLIIACLLILALARPMMNLAALKGQSFVVLVDTSASMKSREETGTRLDKARESLRTMINDMSRDDEMMIVAFDREARVLQSFTDDRARLLAVANDLQARDATSSIRDALMLARNASEARSTPITMESGEIGKGASNVEVVVLSDGAIGDLERAPEDLPPLRFVPIGSVASNVGIVNADLRDTFERESDRQILATVQNFGAAKTTTRVECYLDGSLIDAKSLDIEPGASAAAIFANFRDRSGHVELRLSGEDLLETDNVAHGLLSKPEPKRVLVVGNKNVFLEKMLASHPQYRVFLTTLDKYDPAQPYDVTIFDNVTPPPQLPPGRYLLFNALPQAEGFSQDPEPLASPLIIDWNRVHPLTRYVNFESINISQAMHARIPSWAQTLAEGELSPLIFAFERDQRQMVVVAFDIFQSDWPLRVSFPIFISNALGWLSQSGSAGESFAVKIGSTVPLSPGLKPASAEVTSPSGEKRQFSLNAGEVNYYSQTDEVGLYEVRLGETTSRFAVNLVSAEESNTAPRETLQMGPRQVVGNPSVLKQNREVWFWFALIALAVLGLEWVIYCRRAWA